MSQNVVVIGAVALGPKAASRLKRVQPDAKVTMIDANDYISYGGCGIPYYVSGDVSEASALQTTMYHLVRDPEFFNDVKGVDVKNLTRATKIDRENKQVLIKDLKSGEESALPYDKLVLGTGSLPRKLNLPGEDLEGVHNVGSLNEAIRIRESISKGQVGKAVIVGAGFIGLEMAEAFADMWGIEVDVVEIADQILPGLTSPTLAQMGQNHMEQNDVRFHFGDSVTAIEGEDGKVKKVITSKGEIEADLVILSAGVVPCDELAKDAGLDVHERGGILVNNMMQTSDPDIYAGGDCVLIKNEITGEPLFLPLGSMSNRQGRVIGNNLAGGHQTFDGASGSWVVKLFETSMSGVGLSLPAAKRAGFDAETAMVITQDRAHFYPEKALMVLEAVVERGTRRVLGVQGFGAYGDAMVGRINVVAAMLKNKPTVDDLSNVEIAYSPPFAAAMDILNTLGNVADNVLSGLNTVVSPEEFIALWENRNDDLFFLDCRETADADPYLEKYPEWHNIPQGHLAKRINEVPKDKRIVLMCNTGTRSYEAQVIMDANGIKNCANVKGGLAGLRNLGYTLI
ncbi:MAG: FAD-dependent oxidoreductase [Desulfovibrio sp.]